MQLNFTIRQLFKDIIILAIYFIVLVALLTLLLIFYFSVGYVCLKLCFDNFVLNKL